MYLFTIVRGVIQINHAYIYISTKNASTTKSSSGWIQGNPKGYLEIYTHPSRGGTHPCMP